MRFPMSCGCRLCAINRYPSTALPGVGAQLLGSGLPGYLPSAPSRVKPHPVANPPSRQSPESLWPSAASPDVTASLSPALNSFRPKANLSGDFPPNLDVFLDRGQELLGRATDGRQTGANPTIILTGLLGYGCADVGAEATSVARAASTTTHEACTKPAHGSLPELREAVERCCAERLWHRSAAEPRLAVVLGHTGLKRNRAGLPPRDGERAKGEPDSRRAYRGLTAAKR